MALARLLAKPKIWPKFQSPLRSTAVTARLGRVLGIAFGICFVTGMLSHYQYHPWTWLPEPAAPLWGYRLTQGLHVATGTAAIPLLLVKLWSVYPNLFRWPPIKSIKHGLERGSVAVLVASALLQLFTGFFNALNWYPWPWDFVTVHRFLAYVVIGSILLHIAIKLPDIKYGLSAKVADGDVLTETPWNENPDSHSNVGLKAPPVPTGLSRRGVLAATGAGIGIVVVTSVGQTITPLEPVGLLAIRQSRKGPQRVPINRTAQQAKVTMVTAADWQLAVKGPKPYLLIARRGRGDGGARGASADQLRGGLERGRAVARAAPARPRHPGRRVVELSGQGHVAGERRVLPHVLRRRAAGLQGTAGHAPERGTRSSSITAIPCA